MENSASFDARKSVAISTRPATWTDENALLDPELRVYDDSILDDWAGDIVPDLLRPQLLHELFESTVDIHGGRTALVCDKISMTYSELETAANRLAHHLRLQGVRPGECVGMLLPRSTDVYVTLLAVMKAGGAYVPIDPDYPAERVEYILSDCGIRHLVTVDECIGKASAYKGRIVRLDHEAMEIAASPSTRFSRTDLPLETSSLCYVIYTSGSTGKPKGVQIEHRNATHLVRAEQRIYRVLPGDRVYQGFSIAFDASVEEVWMAFFNGAALIVGTREMMRSGPALSKVLTDLGVTFFSTVPTLLSILDDDIPTLRILILGGEACRPDLVKRWYRPGRRVFNTYGPTEATVIATLKECTPDEPVTIGRPISNYFTYILNEEKARVAPGEPGELYIGGMGLARGYVGRPELTAERFIANPFESALFSPRLYKTGDLVKFSPTGEIEFLGRTDNQVKIRGFRVELSEIENALGSRPEIADSVVTVRDMHGMQQIVAYVVPRAKVDFDEAIILADLRKVLPAYMVPSFLEQVRELPTLPSGKVDRSRLAPPKPRAPQKLRPEVKGRNVWEERLLEVWRALFAPTPVGLTEDFFMDLGGHSLLAARMVSELRKDTRFESLSMLDVYNHPTVEKLAVAMAARSLTEESVPAPTRVVESEATLARRHRLCTIAQTIGLYFVIGLYSLQWLTPYLTYFWFDDYPIRERLFISLASLLAVYPTMLVFGVIAKWTIVGRFKPGRYPMWGSYYFRWWLIDAIFSTVPLDYLAGTPLLGMYYRLLGAKIGKNVHFGSDSLGTYDLISVGDDASIGCDSTLLGSAIQDGELVLGPVSIGKRAVVGIRTVLVVDSHVSDDARIEDLSMLSQGTRVPTGESWKGSPAALSRKGIETPTPRRPSTWRKFVHGAIQSVGILLFPCFIICAIFPGLVVLNYFEEIDASLYYGVVVPAVALSFVILLCLEIAAAKWLLVGRVKPGTYDVYSGFYLRKWLVDRCLELSLDVVGPLYSTIYLAPWYRLLGAKLGKRAEISTASFISPDLLTIEDEGFIADCVSLGAGRVENNVMTLAETKVGKRSFIGNSAFLPLGTTVGDNALVGCLSLPPAAPLTVADDTSWLGSPSFLLPQRQKSSGFSEETTFKPTKKLWAQRIVIEFLRVVMPLSCFIGMTSAFLTVVVDLQEKMDLWKLLVLFPVLYLAAGLIAAAIVITLKWVLMGKYRPCERPLWSNFVWRTEFLTAMHENFSDLFFTSMLKGTAYLPMFFRLMGCKIGKRVYMETTCLTEFDLITIGDDVVLNQDATVQTHLFEDRVMKMSDIKIGDRCTVGVLSLVLYDTEMKDGSTIGDLSLLMKNESLPANTRWEGIPARRR